MKKGKGSGHLETTKCDLLMTVGSEVRSTAGILSRGNASAFCILAEKGKGNEEFEITNGQ